MKRLLIVTPCNIYPHNHGGKIDIYNSLLQISHANIDLTIDLLYCDYRSHCDGVDELLKKELNLTNISYLPIKKNKFLSLVYLFRLKPNYCMLYRGLKAFSFSKRYDYVLIHGFHADSIISNPHLSEAKFIYRMHNYEFYYSRKKIKFEVGLLNKAVRLLDAYKIKFRELKLLQFVHSILFISYKEYLFFNACFGSKSYFLPTYQNDVSISSFDSSKHKFGQILFVGNLFTGYNLHGLYWYLENVHPILKEASKEYTFCIVGNSAGFEINRLKNMIKEDERVVLYENVESLSDFYQQSIVFINPMQNGAGVKIKTLDALKNGMPLVSTSIGVEGTGLEHLVHCLVYDDHEHFAKAILQLMNDSDFAQKLVYNGQSYLQKYFCNTDIIKKIYE